MSGVEATKRPYDLRVEGLDGSDLLPRLDIAVMGEDTVAMIDCQFYYSVDDFGYTQHSSTSL